MKFLKKLTLALLAAFCWSSASAETVPGTIDGQISVGLNGSSSYTVPIAVPSGTAGMAPKLFLSYDSNSGPGQFGLGWSLQGASSITRINRTAFIDGRPSPVLFDDTQDAIALDGARLVAAPEGGRYLAKSVDDQTRVWRNGSSYIAKTKAGLTLYFGESRNSQIPTVDGKIATWALSRIEDTFGNQIVFLYTQSAGDFGIDKVFWTLPKGGIGPANLYDEGALRASSFAHLEVTYQNGNQSYSFGFVGGERTSRSLLATKLTAYVGDVEFRRYDFQYDATGRFGGHVLSSITEVGADTGGPRDEYPKTMFTYTDFEPHWNQSQVYQLPADFGSYRSLGSGYRLIDLDGDGDRDLLYSAFVDGHSLRRSFKQNPNQWSPVAELAPPLDFSSDSDETDSIVFFDSDADNLPEIYSSRMVNGSRQALAYLQDGGSWVEAPQREPPFTIIQDGERLLRTFPSQWAAEPRLLSWDRQGELSAWSINQGEWENEPVSGWLVPEMPAEVLDGDFDCDGLHDLAVLSENRREINFFQKSTSSSGVLELDEIGGYSSSGEISISKLLTRDACDNVLIWSPTESMAAAVGVDPSGQIELQELPLGLDQADRMIDLFPIDIDGLGPREVAVLFGVEAGKPNISIFRFDQSSGNWVKEPTFDYLPSSPGETVDSTYLISVEDIDDDKLEDVLLLPVEAGVTTKALRNSGSALTLVLDFVPPIEFARQEKAGASPQFVDLNADGLVDVVGYYLDKDGKEVINTAQINTMRGWTGVDALRLPKPITREKGGSSGAFVDFNSDGIADFVYAYGDMKEWGAWTIEFDSSGNALRWVQAPDYTLPPEARLSDPDNGDLGVRFLDLNADGRVDVLVARRELDGSFFRRAFLNSGTGWINAPASFLPPVPFVSRNRAEVHYETKVAQGEYFRDLRVSVLDLNGDGLSDLAFRYGHKAQSSGLGLSYSPGKDWCLNRDTVVPRQNQSAPPTIIKHPIPSETQCAGVYLATGSGWNEAADSYLPPIKLDLSIEEENSSLDISDLNGDGLPDLVPARLIGSSNAYPAYLNTGKSWHAESAYAVPVGALSADKNLVSHRIMDINGDGLVDIAFNRPGSSKGSFLNTGTGWIEASADFAPPEPFINEKGEDQGVRFIDVDGNGMPDALRSYRDKSGNLTQSAYLNSGDPSKPHQAIESRVDMLKTVSNGMGLTTTFGYRSLLSPRALPTTSQNDFYTPSPISPYPIISHVPTMYAVQEMSFVDTDGSKIATRYKYKGFRFDVPAAAVLGFEQRTAWNLVNGVESGIVEQIDLFQDYFRVGRSKREVAIVDGVPVSETRNTYALAEQSVGTWPKRLMLTETSAANRDLNGDETGSTRQIFEYDSFNNATATCVEYGDGSRTLTKNTYDNSADITSPAVLFLGRLERAVVSHYRTSNTVSCTELLQGLSGVPPNEVVSNTAEFAYDIRRDAAGRFDAASSGVLVREISNADHSLAVTKAYQHDRYGNVVRETYSTTELPPRSKSMEYDPNGRYVVTERNALGHQIYYEFSELLGQPTKVIDANVVEYQNEYDGFGRLISATSPTELRATDAREFVSGLRVLGRAVAFKQVRQLGRLPEVATYFDYQGRVLRTERIGRSNDELRKIFQDSEYDARGRPIAVSLPYFEGDESYFSRTEFDNLDRAVRTVAPDGGVAQSTFSGLVTTVTDANGKSSTTRLNMKGLIVETTDNLGGILRFDFGPADRLLTTVQVDGQVLVHEYDRIGNKVTSIDPDLGRWDYQYNGFGEVVWQRDAKGQVTTISYDLLGRPIQRHMPDKLDEFQYDTTPFGVGRPSIVSSSDGYEERFFYDSNGRVYRKATRIDGELYSTSVVYDDYDRPTQIHYPGNYIVFNEYDDLGYLRFVRANDPLQPFLAAPKTYWTAVERDQYGRVLEETLGNGVTSTYTYDPLKGNLGSVKAVSEDDTAISDVTLEYDLVGNLLSKLHGTEERRETFRYDGLDRLTAWDVNGATKGRYTYDASGRILSKSDMGVYSYEGDGPSHGVKRVERPDGSSAEYQYDANGNMVFGPKGHFEYYSDNSVKLIYRSKDVWSRFSYAPDGSRYFQHYSETRSVGGSQAVTNVLQTISLGAYEKIRDLGGPFIVKPGGFQRHRLYLAAEGGVVAVLEHSTEFDPLVSDPTFKAGREGTPLAIALTTTSASYLHKDELGSVLKVTNGDGAVVSGYTYDPWGKKSQVAWLAKGREDFADGTFHRGFTGHEHLDNLSLIHMNGRVYDPDLARFVSADPTLQFPMYAQNYDRYSYVLNNPLSYTDPSGFGLGSFFKKLGNAISKPFQEVGKWVEKNWREIVIVVVTVAAVIVTGPGGALAMNAILSGMVVGAVSAGVSTALYGGSFSDVLGAMVLGAAVGGLSAGVADAIGTYGLENGWAEGGVQKVAAHGTAGGLQAEISGGDFKSGFMSAAITQAFAPRIGGIKGFEGAQAARIASAAAVGGTASVLGGGKFANGAVTAAFMRAYNDELHFDGKKLTWKDDAGKVLEEYEGVSGDVGFQNANSQNLANKGPIPEGSYDVRQSRYQKMGDRSYFEMLKAELGGTAWPGGESSWGRERIWVSPRAGTETYGRSGFSIHGGSTPGSRGCIDLCGNNSRFMSRFRSYGKDMVLTVDY